MDISDHLTLGYASKKILCSAFEQCQQPLHRKFLDENKIYGKNNFTEK